MRLQLPEQLPGLRNDGATRRTGLRGQHRRRLPDADIEVAKANLGRRDRQAGVWLVKGTPADSIVDAIRRAWSRMVAVAT